EPIDIRSRERFVREVVERTAAPERKRRAQPLCRRVRFPVRQQSPTLSRQLLEALGVELIGTDLQHVSRRAGDDQLVLAASATWLERLAKVRDVTLEHVRCGLRRRLAPE